MVTKYLWVKGCEGLGNRLYTICSAIEYAKRNERTLVIDWSDGLYGKKGNNIFWENFKVIGVPILRGYPDADEINTIYPNNNSLLIPGNIYDQYNFVPHLKFPGRFYPYTNHGRLSRIWHAWAQVEENHTQSWKRIIHNGYCEVGSSLKDGLKQDVVFFLDYRPDFNKDTFLKHIRLNDLSRQQVDYLSHEMQLEQNTVGLHIRASDKMPTKNVTNIIKIMKQQRLENQAIFLATDNKRIEELFENEFSQVATVSKVLPDTNTGFHNREFNIENHEMAESILSVSILDMWLLGRCKHLFYQGNSTFSQISRILHKGSGIVLDWLEVEV